MTHVHSDLTDTYSTSSEIYGHLFQDQKRDIRIHQMWSAAMWVFAFLAATGFMKGWNSTPWLAVGAIASLERTLWFGRELSNRNYIMHAITFRKLDR